MKKFFLLVLVCGGIAVTGQAQQSVYPLPLDSGQSIKGQTFCYMLPSTALKITATITKVREIKGYYAEYAQSLLGLNDIITENRTYNTISNMTLETVQVPDTAHLYLVKLSKNQIRKNQITKITCEKDFLPLPPERIQNYTTKVLPVPDFFKNYSDLSYVEKEDSFVETKIIDGVVTQVPATHTRLVPRSANRKAQEAADAIFKSRKDQYDLIAGEQETPYPEKTLNLMLKELKQWEQDYLSLFKGLILEDEMTYTFYVTPDPKHTRLPLFACDHVEGFSTDVSNAAPNTVYYIQLVPVYDAGRIQQLLDDSRTNSTGSLSGYRIRRAMPVRISLLLQDEVIFDFGIFNMSQFGSIQTLPLHQDNVKIKKLGFVY